MANADDLGRRGEALFLLRITDFCGGKQQLFRPHFLGEKCPTLDYLVELLGAGLNTPFFFAQVKATRLGCTKGKKQRLRVKVSGEDVQRMAAFPAPTYLIGIDEPREAAFIWCVHAAMKHALPSLPTDFPVDGPNLRRLWQEVKDYWDGRDMRQQKSFFSV